MRRTATLPRQEKSRDACVPAPQEQMQTETKTFSFELITPMLGGDTESWKLDLINPVRTQSIKGQLRFWWRTMQTESDPAKLLSTENKVWGGERSSDKRQKSPVSIAAIHQNVIEKKPAEMANQSVCKNDVIPTNVLFPITSVVKNEMEGAIKFITKMTFDLIVTYPLDLKQDVMDSLTLWTLFGGVGARTRRGTGSLYCEDLLRPFESPSDIKAFVQKCTASHTEAAVHSAPYPQLNASVLAMADVGSEGVTAPAWHSFLTHYGDYRQARNNAKSNHPGRSFWPEPDSIRRITKKADARHQPAHPDQNWFPRAAFGMPVITEFRTNNSPGDPNGKYETSPKNHKRWPSPMILKVIKLPNQKVWKTVFVLNHKVPEAISISAGNREIHTLPDSETPLHTTHPSSGQMREMRTDSPLKNNETVYEHLIRSLNVTVI